MVQVSPFWVFFIILLLYWGYIVTFTKVLTIYHKCLYFGKFYHPFKKKLKIQTQYTMVSLPNT
jgi:hypothetical protein